MRPLLIALSLLMATGCADKPKQPPLRVKIIKIEKRDDGQYYSWDFIGRSKLGETVSIHTINFITLESEVCVEWIENWGDNRGHWEITTCEN